MSYTPEEEVAMAEILTSVSGHTTLDEITFANSHLVVQYLIQNTVVATAVYNELAWQIYNKSGEQSD